MDSANRWLTLAANVAVLAGIVFLAFELQQNTVATRLEVASHFQDSFSEIEMMIAGDPEFAELLTRGRTGGDLSTTEQFRISVFYTNVLRQWQFVHFQYLTDALDEEIWRGQRAYFQEVVRGDAGLFDHWNANKTQYSPRFNELVQSMAAERRS